jgi:hypothetical protein
VAALTAASRPHGYRVAELEYLDRVANVHDHLDVVLDEQQRHSVRVHNVVEGGDQAPGFPRIQPGGRLVEKHDLRAGGQGLGARRPEPISAASHTPRGFGEAGVIDLYLNSPESPGLS